MKLETNTPSVSQDNNDLIPDIKCEPSEINFDCEDPLGDSFEQDTAPEENFAPACKYFVLFLIHVNN